LDQSQNVNRGYVICLVGTIIWSTTGIFIRYLTVEYQLPVFILAFWRDFFVSLFLLFVFSFRFRNLLQVKRSSIPFLFFFGIVLTGFNLLWTFSVALNGAAVATVLAYSSAGYTTILERIIYQKKLRWEKVVIVFVVLGGCILISGAYDLGNWSANTPGIITGFLSGIGFAIYSLMGKKSIQNGINSWTTLFYTFVFASVFLLFFILFYNLLPNTNDVGNFFWLGNEYMAWVILIVLAIGPTIGGYGLYTQSMVYLSASVANIIATLEPLFTAILAFTFLGERLILPQIIGGVMIIGSVIVLNRLEE
jgi:DME family drug/metabolite transporter